MPGWSFVEPPTGFGWAPDRHFRAVMTEDGGRTPVVIRHSWSIEGHETERHLYESVLGRFPFVTPQLLASFSIEGGETPWMVLEDIGELVAERVNPGDRRAFLQALGQLHGCCLALLESAQLAMGPLTHFPESHAHTYYREWEALLTQGIESNALGIPASSLRTCRRLGDALAAEPQLLLHGDTDCSNAVVTGRGIGLVDWERACLGPASIDLSRVVLADALLEDMQVYRSAFSRAAGTELTDADAIKIGRMGILFDALRSICYYVRQTTDGNDPGEDWRKRYYQPSIECLDSQTWLELSRHEVRDKTTEQRHATDG